MTLITGKLFEDGRSGFLVIKPSKPFFGCSKQEKVFPVNDGEVSFEVTPTPPGHEYMVGFKEPGDQTRTEYTLKWRIPNEDVIDITPKKKVIPTDTQVTKATTDRVHVKRLTTELAVALQKSSELQEQLNQSKLEYRQLQDKFEAHKQSVDKALVSRDLVISSLEDAVTPEVRTVYKEVSVPSAPLKSRITYLEAELDRLNSLNKEYYESVVELHQLKLDRAHSLPSPGPISAPDDTPRQRLINKIINNR